MQRHVVPLPVIACLLACSPSLAGAESTDAVQSGAGSAALESGATMTLIPLSDAVDREFRPLRAWLPEGPQIVVLEGDPDSGPSLTLFRFEPDYTGSGRLHTHTHDYRLWVIEGALKHWGADGSEDTASILGPGSYVHQPGEQLHAANCVAERCTAYVLFDGPIETSFLDNP